MASDPQLEFRVSRLENDVSSIHDLITEIGSVQHQHSARFDAMNARFDGVDARFDGVDALFDGVGARFDGIESTLTEILRRLPEPT